nr:phage antirepressor KilAC domain-containing protein [Chryseobacterium sp. RU37D]
MNELIKITEHNGSKAVSARELHVFLEIKTRFDKWANRMFEYGFTENIDYQALVKNDQTLKREVLEDYALSMDCAKEISMIQRSEKGKQARQYFIECEKELKSLPQPSQYHVPGSYAEALKLAYQQAEQIELQSNELKKQAPKVQYFDNVLQSASTYSTNQISLELGMTSIALNKKLKEMCVQYKQNDTWFLYAKYRDKGYTKSKTHHYTGTDGTTQTKTYMVWTESGRLFIHGLIKGNEKSA